MNRAAAALLACAVAFGADGALAQTSFMTADAFRDWTEGRVVRTDRIDGTPFGTEAFGTDGQVVWHGADGTCLTGQWKAEAGSICYHYDGQSAPSCLRYEPDGASLIGYQWSSIGQLPGFLGLILRLTPTETPPLGCAGTPVG